MCEKVLEKLPSMTAEERMQLRQNCFRAIQRSKDALIVQEAKRVLAELDVLQERELNFLIKLPAERMRAAGNSSAIRVPGQLQWPDRRLGRGGDWSLAALFRRDVSHPPPSSYRGGRAGNGSRRMGLGRSIDRCR